MKTLKLVFIGLSVVLLSSCFGAEERVVHVDSGQKTEEHEAQTEIDKSPQQKNFEGMSADEASSFFGFDFEPKLSYSGSYEYYLDQGKEILHGEIKIKSKESREEFIEKYSQELGGDIEAGQFYLQTEYEGSYKDGSKHGLFKQTAEYYEAAGVYTISFEDGQCTNGTYDGNGEGFCFKYNGPLKECKFSEIEGLTEEVECE
jgi:hypothetical protein